MGLNSSTKLMHMRGALQRAISAQRYQALAWQMKLMKQQERKRRKGREGRVIPFACNVVAGGAARMCLYHRRAQTPSQYSTEHVGFLLKFLLFMISKLQSWRGLFSATAH